jgi:hypothetical protein
LTDQREVVLSSASLSTGGRVEKRLFVSNKEITSKLSQLQRELKKIDGKIKEF